MKKKKNFNLWEEKYRPHTLDDVIFANETQRQQFKKYIADKEIPQLLLSGVQGTGKSTISNALIRELEVDSADVMKLNCAEEQIEAIREKVLDFSRTLPLGDFKVVQLEELDGLSIPAQRLLRAATDETNLTCRFICTLNHENLLEPAFKSRFHHYRFKTPNQEQIALRACDILDREKVLYDPDVLFKIVEVNFPDIRQTIISLQKFSIDGKLVDPSSLDEKASVDWKFGLLDKVVAGDFRGARKLVVENAAREDHETIFTFMYQNIAKCDKFKSDVSKLEEAILVIARYLVNHSTVADTEINIAAMFIELGIL